MSNGSTQPMIIVFSDGLIFSSAEKRLLAKASLRWVKVSMTFIGNSFSGQGCGGFGALRTQLMEEAKIGTARYHSLRESCELHYLSTESNDLLRDLLHSAFVSIYTETRNI